MQRPTFSPVSRVALETTVLCLALVLGGPYTAAAQYGAQVQFGVQAQAMPVYPDQQAMPTQLQYGQQPGIVPMQPPNSSMAYPGNMYCAPNVDVAPGTCICPGGTQFRSTARQCSMGRCECPANTQWDGANCMMPPPPPPPQPMCRARCNAGQVCVNGICVGNGDLRFTLMWDRPGDMDLHVITPQGTEISYRVRAGDNGNLDRDDRTGIGPENVFWASSPPQGTYLVCVDPYMINQPTNFTLTIAQSGQAVRTMTGMRTSQQRGQCGRGSPNFVTEINIAAPMPTSQCPPMSTFNPSTGRCECVGGTQWDGRTCMPYAQPPTGICRYACPNGTTCVNGSCVNVPQPMPYPPPSTGPMRWMPSSNGMVPQGALQGGNEANGQPLYVCRAAYNGGTHIGKVVGQACNIGWGGAEISLPQYEVLMDARGRWVAARPGYLPPGALQAGNESNGQPLFLCRGAYNGGTHIGKVVGQSCNIGWGGAEVSLQQYEVYVP